MIPNRIVIGRNIWESTNQLFHRRLYPKELESPALLEIHEKEACREVALELISYIKNHPDELVRISYETRSGWEAGMGECNTALLTATFYQCTPLLPGRDE